MGLIGTLDNIGTISGFYGINLGGTLASIGALTNSGTISGAAYALYSTAASARSPTPA